MDRFPAYLAPTIETREIPARECIVIARQIPIHEIPEFLRDALARLFAYAMPQASLSDCFGRFVSWESDCCEIEAGIVTDRPLASWGEVMPSSLGGHRALFARNIGPFNQVERAYTAIPEYAERHGFSLTGSPYEIYLDDPAAVPSRELRTNVYWPLDLA